MSQHRDSYLKLSPTTLDLVREYLAGSKDFVDLERRMLRSDQPTDVMRAGSIVHRILESPVPPAGVTGELGVFIDAESAIDIWSWWHTGRDAGRLSEARLVHDLTPELGLIGGHRAYLSGYADAVEGLDVHDFKTGGYPFGLKVFDRYYDSVQWQAYQFMAHARQVIYHYIPLRYERPYWKLSGTIESMAFSERRDRQADRLRDVALAAADILLPRFGYLLLSPTPPM